MNSGKDLAEEFWKRMQANDWSHAAELFGAGFALEWPLTKEVFDRDGFVAVNAAYPCNGRWDFKILNISGDAEQAVTRVLVSDGVRRDEVISFFTISENKISQITEYWPVPYEPPKWRKSLTIGK